MKRDVILFLALACCARAATPTTIAQNIPGPDGALGSGQVVFVLSAPCTAPDGSYVSTRPIPVRYTAANVVGGSTNFQVKLIPNDTCIPSGTYYTATYSPTGGGGWAETWVVPTSGSSIVINCPSGAGGCVQARVAGPLPVPFSVLLSAVSPGVAAGYYCVQVTGGGQMVLVNNSSCPGNGGGGGGGGGSLSWHTLTNAQWTGGMTNAQWTGLAN